MQKKLRKTEIALSWIYAVDILFGLAAVILSSFMLANTDIAEQSELRSMLIKGLQVLIPAVLLAFGFKSDKNALIIAGLSVAAAMSIPALFLSIYKFDNIWILINTAVMLIVAMQAFKANAKARKIWFLPIISQACAAVTMIAYGIYLGLTQRYEISITFYAVMIIPIIADIAIAVIFSMFCKLKLESMQQIMHNS